MALSNGSKYLTSTNEVPVESDTTKTVRRTGEWFDGIEYVYPSVAAMKADESLSAGDKVRTASYYAGVEGGGSAGIVVSGNLTDNGGTIHELDSGLYVKMEPQGSVSVKMFGAVGDGVTDDTEALFSLASYINERGGGSYYLPNTGAFYSITNRKGDGDNSFWGHSFLFELDGVDGLMFFGNGTPIKSAAGSKYGAFNPTTGVAENINNFSIDYAASPGTVFNFNDCKNVTFYDIEVDGNNQLLDIGGTYGDTGIQVQNTAFRVVGNSSSIRCYNGRFTYMGLDGIAIKTTADEFSESSSVSFYNCVSEYNGRQGLSLSGGVGMSFYNCKFNHTGKGGINSSPGAGVDIEPELGNAVSGLLMDKCEMINNAGVSALFWDNYDLSSNATFRGCTMWGTTNSALWIQGGVGTLVENCEIHGRIIRANNAEFRRCRIDDKEHPDYGISVGTYIAENQVNAVYRDCTFSTTQTRGPFYGNLQDCTVVCGWDSSLDTDGGTGVALGDGINSNVTVVDALTGTYDDTNRFTVIIAGTGRIKGGLNITGNDGNALRFTTQTGPYGYIKSVDLDGVASISMRDGSATVGTRILGGRSSAPTSGVYTRGDIFFDSSPGSGGVMGWVCVSGGTPGTWKTWGNIEA